MGPCAGSSSTIFLDWGLSFIILQCYGVVMDRELGLVYSGQIDSADNVGPAILFLHSDIIIKL